MKRLLCLVILVLFSSIVASAKTHPRRRLASSAVPTPSSAGALRKILELEDHRTSKDRFLSASVLSPSAAVSRAAILALGRIGDTSGFEEMARIMNAGNQELKAIASFSLGIIGGDFPLKLLVQQAALNKSPDVLAPVLVGMGRAGNEKTQEILARYLAPAGNARVIESACLGLGLLWSGKSESWEIPDGVLIRLAQISNGDTLPALSAAFALSRYKGDQKALPVKEIIEALGGSQLVYGKGFLVKALAKTKNPTISAALVKLLSSDDSLYAPLQVEAAKAMAAQDPTSVGITAIQGLLSSSNAGVLVTALETLATYGQPAGMAQGAVDKLYQTSSSVWVRGAALKTLARLSPTTTRPKLLEILGDKLSAVRPAAANAIAGINSPEDGDLIASLITENDLKVVEEALDGLMLWGGRGNLFPD